MKNITLAQLRDDAAVLEWLGFKNTPANTALLEECLTRHLDNTDEDGKCFDEVEHTDKEVVSWVVSKLDDEYEYGEDSTNRSFCKKCLKSIWLRYRNQPEYKLVMRKIERSDFIEKLIEDEKAKTLPEGTETWSTTFNSNTGRSVTKHLVVKNGKWVRK